MKKVVFLFFIFLSNWMVVYAQALKQFNIENANNSTEKPIKVTLKKLSNMRVLQFLKMKKNI